MIANATRWPVVSGLGIVQIFTWGSSYFLIAVLAAPITADTGWSLPWVLVAISVGLACAGLISPSVGKALSHYGGRPVLALQFGLVEFTGLLRGLVHYRSWDGGRSRRCSLCDVGATLRQRCAHGYFDADTLGWLCQHCLLATLGLVS